MHHHKATAVACQIRKGLGRRKFAEAAKKLNYPGDAERLFDIFDSIARDERVAYFISVFNLTSQSCLAYVTLLT